MTTPGVTLTRLLEAPRERVFAAFTIPEHLAAWMGPEGCTVPSARADVRVGGQYRIEMHCATSGVHVITGEYREIVVPERLVFTWAWLEGTGAGPHSVVTISLAARGAATELTLRHDGFASPEAARGHEEGWTSALRMLVSLLAGRPKVTTARAVLLGNPLSTYTRSARMAFAEKGIAHALESHAPHTPAIDALHPWGRIPAFKYGEFALFETSAIMRYVDTAFPGPALMPSSPIDAARAEQWISAINAYLYGTMVSRYVLPYLFPKGAGGKPDRTVIDAALPDMTRQFQVLEAAYGANDWLAGDRLTLADLLLAPIVHYVGRLPEGHDLLAQHRNVARAHAAIAARESFRSTMPPVPA